MNPSDLNRSPNRPYLTREGLIYSPLLMCDQKRSTERRAPPMRQQTFAEVTVEHYRKLTPREPFLDEMNRVVPWAE